MSHDQSHSTKVQYNDKSASSNALVDVVMTEIDPTKNCVITVAAKVGATERAGKLFTNTANGIYTSLPGDHGTDAAHGNATGSTTSGDPASGPGERTGFPADSLNNYTNTKAVNETLKAPSIVKNAPTLASAPIGAQTTFDLVVTLPEGATRGLSVTDTLPWGLKPITGTVIKLAADSAYSGGNRLAADFSGTLGTISETATPTDQTHRLWTWTFAGDGNNDVVLPATNNPSGNDDKFLIRITAQVDNILVNQAAHPLTNSSVVTYTNPQTGNPTPIASGNQTVTVYEPDLTVTKLAGNTSPHFGEAVTYTLTIKHTTGATDDITAYDVSLVDAIPAGMAYVVGSLTQTANTAPAPTTWGYSGGNVTMTWDSFPLGGADTIFTYQATVNAPSPLKLTDTIMNTATVNWTSLLGDQAPSERTGADGIGAGFLNNYRVAPTSTVTVTGADMTISKDYNQPTAAAANVLTYVVHYQNDGNQQATNVVISETVPVGTTFNSAASSTWTGCSNGAAAGTACHINIASVAAHGSAGDSGDYNFAVSVIDPIASDRVTIDNTAAVVDDGTHGVDPTDNNTVTHTDTTQTADLSLAKTRDVARPNYHQTVHFTLTLTNAGPDPAANVVVHDTWPAGLTWVSDDSSGAYNHTTGVWTIGTVGSSGPTATKTLVITAQATSVQVSGGLPQPIANVAEVTHSSQRDPDSTPNNGVTSEDDYATVSVTPTLADMAVTKTVDHSAPNVGDDVIFTITATNNGPDIATNAKVVDPLPSGLTWVSATPSVGTWSGSTWTIGDLAVGASATLQLRDHVVTPGSKTNTATVSADPFDPTPPNNNIASRSVTPQQADLAVGKTVAPSDPEIGDTVTFTVTVNNNAGPDTATNVALSDILPGGLTYVSKTVGQGTYDETTGAWIVGTLAKNASATLTIHATVNASGTITNTAAISHSDQYDPVSTNNTAHVDLASRTVDVGVAKSVDHPTPSVGDTIHYTLTVTNHGLSFGVTQLKVTDKLPDGVSYVSDSGGGAYNSTTGVWDIGSLAANTGVTKTITALVTASGRIDNTITFTSMLQTDTVPGDNSATATINVPLAADIAVTKTVDNNRPNVDSDVTFTITATNNGPDNATGVTIADTLPAGLTLVTPTPSGTTTYSAGTWTIGNLANGASETLTLKATVDTAGLRTNTASVSHSNQTDPVPGNNSASVSVDQRVDLTVSKSVDHPTANVGDQVIFTIGLSNA